MTQIRTLQILDLLSKAGPLEVMGVRLDAHVDVVIRIAGRNVPEVDSLEIKQVYMACDSLDDIILLDQKSLKTRHKALYQAFEKVLCIHALNRAAIAPDEAWTVTEETV